MFPARPTVPLLEVVILTSEDDIAKTNSSQNSPKKGFFLWKYFRTLQLAVSPQILTPRTILATAVVGTMKCTPDRMIKK
jgi:hypothetical protein